jgi:NAD(P)-dependent dehydrogenase (short-subunit alcohol dehydrogenase family)
MDQVVVVTGASGGIGSATARLLGSRGARVALVARRAGALDAAVKRAGPHAMAIVADVTVREEVQRTVAKALRGFGQIDVWINNVGRGIFRLPSELSDEDVEEMMRVNVLSALYGMQEVLPHFRERGAGHLINISSMLGRMPMNPMRSAYNGAKHFLNALTTNIRAEVQQTHPDIRVSLVSPGVVRTDFGIHSLHGGPDSRQLPDSQSAEDVARVIADLIETPRPDVYTRLGAHDRVVGYFASLGEDP